jgi:hypothetical protein
MCKRCYNRWVWALPGHRVGEAAERPDPSEKIAYLSSLTEGELAAFCSGVLSRAAVVPGDPTEVAEWMDLVRLTARRAAECSAT